MPLDIRRYIDITSSRAAGNVTPRRELILRVFTTNELVPTGGIVTSSDLDGVINHFGSGTPESDRASFYFGFIGRQGTRARRIDFARWTNVDVAPRIFGQAVTSTVADFVAISDGSLVVTIGGVVADLTGIDLSSVATFADVAAALQTAIRTGTGTVFTAATVTYDAVRQAFVFTGGETGANVISISAGTAGTDISDDIGWRGLTAIISNGAVAETPVDAVSNAAGMNNNFGSFAFITSLSMDQIETISEWNHAQNVRYQYHVPVLEADAATLAGRLVARFSGTGMTLAGPAGEFHELIPSAILASSDYSRLGASQNYMYQTPAATATVTDATTANALDALRVNYMGSLQTAGQTSSIYQRGFMTGPTNAPLEFGTFANEQWLKDAIAASLLTLLTSVGRVSANATGEAQVTATIQSVIDGPGDGGTATTNGVFSIGRVLTPAERVTVTDLTGDPNAFLQIQTLGYWLDVSVQRETNPNSGLEESFASYTLIYARDTVIRRIEGADILV